MGRIAGVVRRTGMRLGAVVLTAAAVLSLQQVIPMTAQATIGHGVTVGTETAPASEQASQYVLGIKPESAEFGTVYQNAAAEGRTVTISNSGTGAADLCWSKTDPEHAFYLDMPDDLSIGAGASKTFTISPNTAVAPGSYTAVFLFAGADDPMFAKAVKLTAKVTVRADEPYVSSVTVTPGSASVARGTSMRFTANVAGGNNPKLSVTWSVSGQQKGTGIDGNGNLNVAADETAGDLTVRATSDFDSSVYGTASVRLTGGNHNVTVMANPAEGGHVTGGGPVNTGGSLTVSASANNGYTFTGWSVNGQIVSKSNPWQINNINADTTATAQFQRTTCKVNLSVNNGNAGRVTGGGTVNYGASTVLTATPNNGYVFTGWQENNNIINTSASMQLDNITGDLSIMAVFRSSRHTVSLNVNPQNSGTVTGQGLYQDGSNAELTATPAQNYHFVGWSLNGKLISSDKTFDLVKITQDYSILANFAQDNTRSWSIQSGVASNGGVITPSGKVMFPDKSSATYTIAPLGGYKILAVEVDGKQVGAVTTYTFYKISGNHSIAAAFTKDKAQSQPAAPGKPADDTGDNSGSGKSDAAMPADSSTRSGSGTDSSALEDMTSDQETMPMDTSDITQETETESETPSGLLAALGMSVEDTKDMIESGKDQPLVMEAFRQGYLNVTVNNQYAGSIQETADNSYESNPSIPNFSDVVVKMLSEEDKISVLQGDPMAININISDYSEFISDKDKSAFERASQKGVSVGSYFNIIFMTTKDGNTKVVTELPEKMQVVMRIPENMKKEGRIYCALRLHDGKGGSQVLSILPDTDSSKDTLTFETDKFSAYAIGYKDQDASAVNQKIKTMVIVGIIIAAGIAATFTLIELVRKRESRE